ncbi:hypothetical protein [Saccharopolyspora sp. ASAGF58]|uniref:hypothetical protein n=1 Tax=Saccharopolyspora sp. ASAGF58 TaxID=2719023 RepID=UPI00143FC0DB|nr:hypothetical protein [Saccharopolyspora sp. ASAGF58]QIZ35813.1 hypothetical protein FDZ84_15290 [Saccharopolyspora sp. ASAGF58]
MSDTGETTSRCRGCDGSRYVTLPRAIMSMTTGEMGTVMAQSRCRHCRETPGRQRGFGPPA